MPSINISEHSCSSASSPEGPGREEAASQHLGGASAGMERMLDGAVSMWESAIGGSGDMNPRRACGVLSAPAAPFSPQEEHTPAGVTGA